MNEKILNNDTTIIVYGGGGYGRSILPNVKAKYPNHRVFYVDGNPALWGTKIEEHIIKQPEAIVEDKNVIVVIASIQGFKNIRKKLCNEFGISSDFIDESFSKQMYDLTFGIREEFIRLYSNVVYDKGLTGCCAEGGVFEGDFASIINHYFPDRKVYLFDTFTGFDDRDLEKENTFTSSRKSGFNMGNFTISGLLNKMEYPQNIEIRRGFFPATAADISDEFIFVNLDFDLYEPTLAGLKFFYPRMKKDGIILVHDYFAMDFIKRYSFDKVKDAVDEFCMENSIGLCPIGDKLSIAIIKQ